MKKSVDIFGLPVVSISEGKKIGTVKRFVIDADNGAATALIVDDGKWYLGARLLMMDAVTGIGEYAVTIDNSNKLLTVADLPAMQKLLENDIKVIDTQVLTKAGRIQGKVVEILVEDTGKIAGCEVEESSGEIVQIPAERILTYGKEVLIIASEDEVLGTKVQPNPAPSVKPDVEVAANVPTREVSNTAITSDESNQAATPTDDSAKKFDDRHRKYLLGKKAGRRIETDNGMLIVDQGGEITEEVVQKAKLAGKFVELSMNIQ